MTYQPPKIYWLFGLSGAGKTTIGKALTDKLRETAPCVLIDGDEFRNEVAKDLGYTEADRTHNVYRAANVAKLVHKNGINVVCAFMTPTILMRECLSAQFTNVLKDVRFIWVNTSIKDCESRDPKGLWKQARQGKIKDFYGVDVPFETPDEFEEVLFTCPHPKLCPSVAKVVERILQYT